MSKKLIALLLAVVMVLTLAACNSEDNDKKNKDKDAATDNAGDQYTEEPTLSDEENTVAYLLINYAPTENDDFFLEVTCTRTDVIAEVNGETHKVGKIDPKVLFDIEEELIRAGFMDLVGLDTYDDGSAVGSFYMEYTDGDQMMINFNGSVPQEFVDAYASAEQYFVKLLTNAPDYVPEPQVEEGVDEAQLKESKDILTKATLENLDKYKIYTAAKDDTTPDTLGLDSNEFMVSASVCESKMFDTPYNLVVIKVSGEENIAAVRADLADGLRWNKFIHVPVSNALIAQKGDLVLCLMAADNNYKNSAKAIADCGWQSITEYKK